MREEYDMSLIWTSSSLGKNFISLVASQEIIFFLVFSIGYWSSHRCKNMIIGGVFRVEFLAEYKSRVLIFR